MHFMGMYLNSKNVKDTVVNRRLVAACNIPSSRLESASLVVMWELGCLRKQVN